MNQLVKTLFIFVCIATIFCCGEKKFDDSVQTIELQITDTKREVYDEFTSANDFDGYKLNDLLVYSTIIDTIAPGIDTADIDRLIKSLINVSPESRLEFKTKSYYSKEQIYLEITRVNAFTNKLKLFSGQRIFFQFFHKGCGVFGSDDPGYRFARASSETTRCIKKGQSDLSGPIGLGISLLEKPKKDLSGKITVIGIKGGVRSVIKTDSSIIIKMDSWVKAPVGFLTNKEYDLSFKSDDSDFYEVFLRINDMPLLTRTSTGLMKVINFYKLTIGKKAPSGGNKKYYIEWCP